MQTFTHTHTHTHTHTYCKMMNFLGSLRLNNLATSQNSLYYLKTLFFSCNHSNYYFVFNVKPKWNKTALKHLSKIFINIIHILKRGMREEWTIKMQQGRTVRIQKQERWSSQGLNEGLDVKNEVHCWLVMLLKYQDWLKLWPSEIN